MSPPSVRVRLSKLLRSPFLAGLVLAGLRGAPSRPFTSLPRGRDCGVSLIAATENESQNHFAFKFSITDRVKRGGSGCAAGLIQGQRTGGRRRKRRCRICRVGDRVDDLYWVR